MLEVKKQINQQEGYSQDDRHEHTFSVQRLKLTLGLSEPCIT